MAEQQQEGEFDLNEVPTTSADAAPDSLGALSSVAALTVKLPGYPPLRTPVKRLPRNIESCYKHIEWWEWTLEQHRNGVERLSDAQVEKIYTNMEAAKQDIMLYMSNKH